MSRAAPQTLRHRRWDADELDWGRECLHAGYSVEDIAEMAGASAAEVGHNLGPAPRLTAKQRTALTLYHAGASLDEIGRLIKPDSSRPRKLAGSYLHAIRRKGLMVPRRCPGRSPDQEARRHG